MRLSLLLVLSLLTGSMLVGCHTCSHNDGGFVGDDGVVYKPVKPNPILKVFEKKSCGCKSHKDSKHKHKGADHCPFCATEGEYMPGVNGGFQGGSSGCSGCGAPASMGPVGCSSCGMPSASNYGVPSSGCSSCGGAPISGCSSCAQGGMPHDFQSSPSPAAIFQGEVIPGSPQAYPSPAPAPAPPAEDKPMAPASPMNNGTALIPILPPSSAPRHVHWIPTPVK